MATEVIRILALFACVACLLAAGLIEARVWVVDKPISDDSDISPDIPDEPCVQIALSARGLPACSDLDGTVSGNERGAF